MGGGSNSNDNGDGTESKKDGSSNVPFFSAFGDRAQRRKGGRGMNGTPVGKQRHPIRTFLVGGVMGIANIIPGVSGGTIAVVFGIYEDLMEALGNFITDREKRWKYVRFLVVLFCGAGISIVIFARVLSWAFEHYPLQVVYFFIGLIIGSIPVVIKTHHDMKMKPGRVGAFLFGLAVVVVLALFQGADKAQAAQVDFLSISASGYLYFFFAGAIAASAMIMPGISGSFILILLGAYWYILEALSDLTKMLVQQGLTGEMVVRLGILASVGIGAVVGILAFSKFMSWALKHFPAVTMYVILGLIIGSLYQIYPGFSFDLRGAGAVFFCVVGILISLRFGKRT
jgi:putative membrane protein